MPVRSSHRLTEKQCRAAKGKDLFDGDGLTLAVRGDGKSWLQRYTLNGKRRKIGLGPYPLISLKEARQAGAEVRRLALQGIDPAIERARRRNQRTFAEVMEDYLRVSGGTDSARWRRRLEIHFSDFMQRGIAAIGGDELAQSLLSLTARKPSTAVKVVSQVNAIFDHAFALGLIDNKPSERAKLVVAKSISKVPKKHHPMVAPEEAPALYADILSRQADPCLLALRLILLLPARSGNVRMARWEQIDMDTRIWRVRAQDTKTGKMTGADFIAPLGRDAFEVISLAQELYGDHGFIFPGSKPGTPMSDMTVSKRLKSFGYRDPSDGRLAVPHGLRATMKTFLRDHTELDQDVIERMLDHKIKGDVQKAYDRAKLVERRRDISEIWADYLCGRDNPKIMQFFQAHDSEKLQAAT